MLLLADRSARRLGDPLVDVPSADLLGRDVPAAVTPCTVPFAACVPSAGTTAFVRQRGTLVTPDHVVCDGEVLDSTATGRITCVGADRRASSDAAGAQVVCTDAVIYPGLIDPHQHADYNHMPVFRHANRYDNRNT